MMNVYDLIPQRPPFLFVDEIIEIKANEIITEKKITGDEPFFQGHFPGMPVMPGVLLLETLFQSGAILMGHLLAHKNEGDSKVGVVTRVNNTKFKRIVVPGNTIRAQVKLVEEGIVQYKFKGKIFVGEDVSCSTDFGAAMADKKMIFDLQKQKD